MCALAGGESRGRWRDGLILEGRGGAGNEGTGSDLAGDRQEDYPVAAAEIIGISDRQMRRWRQRYEEFGYDGLFDRRMGRPSTRRVPLAQVEEVLGLHRDRYFDLNVQHFHEKLKEQHHIDISYTWVKQALQGAGLVSGDANGVPIASSGSGVLLNCLGSNRFGRLLQAHMNLTHANGFNLHRAPVGTVLPFDPA